MELIFCWVDDYRSFEKQQSIILNDYFQLNYHTEKQSLTIKLNEVIHIYNDSSVLSVSAIVGKNGSGKSNILDLIGSRIDERITILSNQFVNGKSNKYFFVYHIDSDNFFIEGNFMPNVNNFTPEIIESSSTEFNWQSGIFSLSNGFHEQKIRTEKSAILLMRNNFDRNFFTERSFDEKDEPSPLLQRRIANFYPRTKKAIVKMLSEQLSLQDRTLFNEDEYTFTITFNNFFYENYMLNMPISIDKNVLTEILSSFVCYFFNRFPDRNFEKFERTEKKFLKIFVTAYGSYSDNIHKFYWHVIDAIGNEINPELFNSYKKEYQKQYNKLYDALKNIKNITYHGGVMEYEVVDASVSFKINKNTDVEEFNDLIEATIDAKRIADSNEVPNVFSDFFKYSIKYLSDGEVAFLELFSSLYEQIFEIQKFRDNFIVLIDEPDQRLHPEMSRRFIMLLTDLVKNLDKERRLNIQFILTTHSPFILTDVVSENVVFLKRKAGELSTIEKKELNLFGGNIHKILIEDFFMDSTIGEFASSKIREVIKAAEHKDELSDEMVIYYSDVIDKIGEPILRNRLRKLFGNEGEKRVPFVNERGSISEIHELLTKQLKELEGLQRIVMERLND